MVEADHLTIAEFADKVGVSKQAIYKQINNPNSQIAPYVICVDRKKFILKSALNELYRVETTNSTPKDNLINDNSTPDNPKEQPIKPNSTQDNQPNSTQYIEFLLAQIQDLKAEKQESEQRLIASIGEKDRIIKEQSAEIAQLAQQMAQIADKALIATSQQQYLTAIDKQDSSTIETNISPVEPEKKGFWAKLFSKW